MNGIIYLLAYLIIMMILSCFIAYGNLMKKIAKSNDVGTKVKLIEFSTDESDSKFYCQIDVDPGEIIASAGSYKVRDQEETLND